MRISNLSLSKKIFILIICIVICAIGARILNSGETLSEYAANHPEEAYASTAESTSN
ncbi:MAG: hypothetical protein IIZ20_10765 [Butyrivibrio sp.]|jgi:hypothetical protein|uniref:hypothetical protein n=1 Tax=Butyrivibrio fibrisolvens TaxID=831 RepID=UPI00040642EE|nr:MULTISPECIES: hypothetical protein [Butyrivibrio]MBQ1458976.1 hypothetical protein [Butyrivibrio sp.]